MKLSEQTIKRLTKSKEGEELQLFLKDQINSLDRVSDIPDEWDAERKSIEVSARKLATEKLNKMLEPLLGFREVTEKEKPEIY